jgi:hypothetical protein
MSKTARETEEMICGHRGCRQPGLFRPILLAAGICLATAGCGWTPRLSPGPTDPASWLFSKPGSKAEREALKKKVEADSFPRAPQAGV